MHWDGNNSEYSSWECHCPKLSATRAGLVRLLCLGENPNLPSPTPAILIPALLIPALFNSCPSRFLLSSVPALLSSFYPQFFHFSIPAPPLIPAFLNSCFPNSCPPQFLLSSILSLLNSFTPQFLPSPIPALPNSLP